MGNQSAECGGWEILTVAVSAGDANSVSILLEILAISFGSGWSLVRWNRKCQSLGPCVWGIGKGSDGVGSTFRLYSIQSSNQGGGACSLGKAVPRKVKRNVKLVPRGCCF